MFFQAGEVSLNDFDNIVAHTSMMNELTVLRGLLKRRYPNLKNGEHLVVGCLPSY